MKSYTRSCRYIRLTSDRQAQHGWLFSRMPMTATNWMVEVEFKIHGMGHLHGDGMAIWMIEERAEPGKVFGHRDNFNGLGVFIDTYKNQRPGTVFPYVMAMVGNSSVSYDKDHDGKDNELAGCSVRWSSLESSNTMLILYLKARGLRGGSIPTKIRLTYYQEVSLKVEVQYKAPDEWTECFETEAIKLPQSTYLGFSAETGELSDNHDIISVSSSNLHIRQDRGPTGSKKAKPYNPGGDKERGSWRWFFLKIVLLGIVVVGGYVGYTMYRASKRNSRFWRRWPTVLSFLLSLPHLKLAQPSIVLDKTHHS